MLLVSWLPIIYISTHTITGVKGKWLLGSTGLVIGEHDMVRTK
jgi:hypothetical protein